MDAAQSGSQTALVGQLDANLPDAEHRSLKRLQIYRVKYSAKLEGIQTVQIHIKTEKLSSK